MAQLIKNKVCKMKKLGCLIVISVVTILSDKNIYGQSEDDRVPEIKGKLVYHTYTSYNAWDSKLYVFDFESKQLMCINDYIKGIYHTMNACFSPDGSQIVFMGITNKEGEEEWNIFCFTLASKTLEQLTYRLRNEDPKFSPDGRKVIYKQGKWDAELDCMIYSLCEMDLSSKEIKEVTNDKIEKSMPYYSRDGKSIYYMEGVGIQSRICNIKLDDCFQVNEIFKVSNIHAYYPVVYREYLYFTRYYATDNGNDIVVKINTQSQEMSIPSFNSASYNTSDPCVISDRLLVISSTRPGGKGGYDLYIADELTGECWTLDKYYEGINNQYEQLGASCYIERIN